MRILKRSLLVVAGAMLLFILWTQAMFWVAPRTTSNVIAGFKIPSDAQFLERGGDSNNVYFKWKLAPERFSELSPPKDSSQLFDYRKDWHPFNLGFFGELEESDVAADGQALYYRTAVWDVALITSRSEGTLIVAGIYTN